MTFSAPSETSFQELSLFSDRSLSGNGNADTAQATVKAIHVNRLIVLSYEISSLACIVARLPNWQFRGQFRIISVDELARITLIRGKSGDYRRSRGGATSGLARDPRDSRRI